jgi:cysteine desulfurase
MVSQDSSEPRHYFDWAATAIPDSPVPDCDRPFGNPSSPHREGKAAREALESARARCAAVLGVKPETLYFTSGGTESNCIVLYAHLLRRGTGRIMASAVEHASIMENIEVLDRMGKAAGIIPVDSSGRVSPQLLSKALEKSGDVRFAALMAVNNETGAINDMAALRDIFRKNGEAQRGEPPVHFHSDLVQAIGKIPLDSAGWDLDSASISAHKTGGIRGIGLLYLRRPLETLYSGGGLEGKIRPGTENTAGALSLAACLENHADPEKLKAAEEAARRRWKKLINALKSIERCTLIPADRESEDERFSPYILQAAFKGVPGEVMVRTLDDSGFAISTGSACSSAAPDRPVLAAMGIENSLRLEGIRISQGWSTTDEEIDLLIAAIGEVLKFL